MQDSIDSPWPDVETQKLVFLLDHATPLERQILERWINTNKPDDARLGDNFTLIGLGYHSDVAKATGLSSLRRLLKAAPATTYFAPLRVLWLPKAEAQGELRLRDMLTGDPRAPGPLKQKWIAKTDPARYRPIAAAGASVQELTARLELVAPEQRADEQELAAFVARQALLALERAECAINGVRYKVPRLVSEEVLAKPRLQAAIAEYAKTTGRSVDSVTQEAQACLKEMAANHSTYALDIMAGFGRYLYTRGFDRQIEYLPADLERIDKLSKQHPVVYLMTHKSHIDGFLMISLFHELNLPPLHTFGGINMNFLGLGTLARRSGTVFLRRTFADDEIYKLVFKNYIDYLVEKRFALLWALEGTRSRTGKLMPPRYGLMNYVVDSYVRAATTDVVLMPVSIAYDQVPEVADYIAEQKGQRKRPESASWFMQYISGMNNPHGKIHVRFGQGVVLSEVLGDDRAALKVTPLDIQKLAFKLSVDANNVTPVTGTALVTFVLLAQGHKALTLDELARQLQLLVELINVLQLPTTEDVDIATLAVLTATLDALAHNGVVSAYKDGLAPVYSIAPDASMAAAYYRNTLVHFFVTSAIAELALLAVAEQRAEAPLQALHDEALRLRDVLKFDFFFADKDEFIVDFERQLTLRSPDWRTALAQGSERIFMLLWELKPLLAHGTLRPFLEAYQVAAEALLLETASTFDKKQFVKRCSELGKQRVLQQRIVSEESVSTVYFEPAMKLAEGRGLLAGESAELTSRRHEFAAEMAELVRRLAFISTLAENRRMGVASINANALLAQAGG